MKSKVDFNFIINKKLMRKVLFLSGFAIAGLLLMSTQIKNESLSNFFMAKFTWKATTHDFGKIVQGKPVSSEFTFKNTGSIPLVISNVQGSCGCTVTDYTKEAVAPGKEGMVKATFNSARTGVFSKTVTVTANIEGGTEVLTIKGEVILPKDKEQKES
jgi:hypothetical protein